MSKGRKIALVIAFVVAGFLLAVFVIAPRLFDVNRYRPDVIAYIEQQTGRRVEMSRLALSVFPTIKIRVDNFGMANPPGFPEGNWLTVQHIHASVDFHSLWSGQLVIRALKLDQPVLNLLSNQQGHWNYELSPPAAAASGAVKAPPTRPVSLNERLARTCALQARGFSFEQKPQTSKTEVCATPPSQSTWRVVAARPNAGNQAKETPLFSLREISKVTLENGRLTVRNSSPNSGQQLSSLEASGISLNLGNVNVAAFTAPPGAATGATGATGNVSLASLVFGNLQATKVKSGIQAAPGQVKLAHLQFDLYGGRGTGAIQLNMDAPNLQYQAQAELKQVNVAELLKQFPRLNGTMTGKLDTQLSLSGTAVKSSDPWKGKSGAGVVTIRDGRWPKLQLNKTLMDLIRVAQIGPASGNLSSFSSISADWQLALDVVTTKNIRITGKGVTVDGSGTANLSGAGALHYRCIAQIVARQNPLTSILATVSGATFQNGQIRLPFAVNGTLEKPVFALQPNSALGASGQPATNPASKQQPDVLRNLFKLLQPKK